MSTNQIKNQYVLLSREVTTDSVDKMNSIIKIIDTFNFGLNTRELDKNNKQFGEDVLMIPATYSIATSWLLGAKTTKENTAAVKINMYDSKGFDLGGPSQELKVPKGSNRINMNFGVNGFPLKNRGDYKLKASLKFNNKTTSAEYPFMVNVDLSEE